MAIMRIMANEKPNFVHLHVHSHYSLLDGMGKIPVLYKRAEELNMPALALTDHGVMHGFLEHYKIGKKTGINPIVGCEIYVAKRSMEEKVAKIDQSSYHLTLLAENNLGLKNLIQLTSDAHLYGYYYRPRVDKEYLKNHNQGLIALSGCFQGEIPTLLLSDRYEEAKKTALLYQEIFGKKNFFIELQNHPSSPETAKVLPRLIKLAEEIKAPLVATADVHYVYPEDALAQDALVCISTGKLLSDKNRISYMDFDVSMITPEKMANLFQETPEALKNTLAIAERCNVEIELGKTKLPYFPVPEDETEESYFEKRARKGMNIRYGSQWPKEAKERFDYEISVIKKMGYASYFLIVQDFVLWAKQNGIGVGPGRGSAAGSIVAYALQITNLDPLKHRLLFERFLNPERVSLPDIDIDFEDRRRSEVINYVAHRYGHDHVAQIATFGTLAARNVVRDVGRVMGLSYSEVDAIAKMIPMHASLKEALTTIPELGHLVESNPSLKTLFELAQKLEGNVRHASTHAAGVVISRQPLTEYLPVMRATRNETEIMTQVDMGAVEELGLLKMDFLGLANLSIIKDTLAIVKEVENQTINIEKIPLDDRKTYELLSKAETSGVFQLESAGMKRYLSELQPSNFNDITAIIALYRPGPIERIPEYIAHKLGKQKVDYLHPDLEKILKETYGILVYQEQVQELAQRFAGFSLGEGYLLVKAIAKKKKDLLEKQKQQFIEGAKKKGYEEKLARKLFEFIEPFARYGFNRAHSAAYALIAYQTSYLKAHFPEEFMAAWLRAEQGVIEKTAFALAECERMGITVLPPNINSSSENFDILKDKEGKKMIIFGISAIKNVGEQAAKAIVAERKRGGGFSSLEDFIIRVGHRHLNRKILEALIQAGALDEFAERGSLLASLDEIIKYAAEAAKEAPQSLQSLFADQETVRKPILLKKTVPIDLQQKLIWEKNLLGIYVSQKPLSQIEKRILDSTVRFKELENYQNKRVRVVGVLGEVKKILTKNKEPMLFAQLEEGVSKIELVVFPGVYNRTLSLWRKSNILVAEGKVSDKDGEMKILVDKVFEYSADLELPAISKENNISITEKVPSLTKESPKPPLKALRLHLPNTVPKKTLEQIKEMLALYKGNLPVFLKINNGKELKTKTAIEPSPLLLRQLKRALGEENVEIT